MIALSSSVAGTQAARTEVLAVIKELRQRTKDVKKMPSIVVAKPGAPLRTDTSTGAKAQVAGKLHLSASAEVGPTFDKKAQIPEERRHSYPHNTSAPLSKSYSGTGSFSSPAAPRPSSAFLSTTRRNLWGTVTDDDSFPAKVRHTHTVAR